jgi:hypothetical protein
MTINGPGTITTQHNSYTHNHPLCGTMTTSSTHYQNIGNTLRYSARAPALRLSSTTHGAGWWVVVVKVVKVVSNWVKVGETKVKLATHLTEHINCNALH